MKNTRPAAVSGLFYPANAVQLTHELRRFLDHASPPDITPKALLVPHAGYIYSGAIAAKAYATLAAISASVRRVVLLGPTHRVAVRGLVLPAETGFETPLGIIPVDPVSVDALRHLEQVTVNSYAHAQEHSLEVQLPFLQTVLADFTLLPLAVGTASPAEVAEVLEALWGGDETLIVISSDLSHYQSYLTAKRSDYQTVQSILNLQLPISHESACGATPISGLITAAKHHHLIPKLLEMCNSGDTAGSRHQVVGYASIAFIEEQLDVVQ